MADAAEFDTRILQAVVAGGFVALGWLVNGWQNRRAARALRAERLRDVHRALFAEIGAHLSALGDPEALDAHCARITGRIEADTTFVPLVPHLKADQVFQAVVVEIHVLPRTSIDPVVAYYNQLGSIAALIEDMRSERFASVSQGRKILIYRDYIEMQKQAIAFGHHALRMIDAYAKGGREAARKLGSESRKATLLRQERAVSSPGEDRSDRSRGSE